MRLNHIGLNISHAGEPNQFYQEILGFVPLHDFSLPKDISHLLFGIEEETKVFVLQNGQVKLELFLHHHPIAPGYAHLCLEMDDREETVRKGSASGYQVIRRKREKGDLLFIKDKSGNLFELKNQQP
jgi:catechol 2,3-dioxygenase-like lactoylglutathione lyase family enzyme